MSNEITEENKKLKSQFAKLEHILDEGFILKLERVKNRYFINLYDKEGEGLDYRGGASISTIDLNDFIDDWKKK